MSLEWSDAVSDLGFSGFVTMASLNSWRVQDVSV